jgi:hypothetical protein
MLEIEIEASKKCRARESDGDSEAEVPRDGCSTDIPDQVAWPAENYLQTNRKYIFF